MNAATPPPSPERSRAEFSHFGWRLHHGAEATGIDARLVSCHELYHDRLQLTTAHGFLTHVVAALATETEDAHWETLLAGLQSCARRVHEQFAAWSSTTTLMLTGTSSRRSCRATSRTSTTSRPWSAPAGAIGTGGRTGGSGSYAIWRRTQPPSSSRA